MQFLSAYLLKAQKLNSFFGIDDKYTKGGEYQFLLDKFNLKAEKISKMIIKHLK